MLRSGMEVAKPVVLLNHVLCHTHTLNKRTHTRPKSNTESNALAGDGRRAIGADGALAHRSGIDPPPLGRVRPRRRSLAPSSLCSKIRRNHRQNMPGRSDARLRAPAPLRRRRTAPGCLPSRFRSWTLNFLHSLPKKKSHPPPPRALNQLPLSPRRPVFGRLIQLPDVLEAGDPPPASLRLSAEALRRDGAFLLDDGLTLVCLLVSFRFVSCLPDAAALETILAFFSFFFFVLCCGCWF